MNEHSTAEDAWLLAQVAQGDKAAMHALYTAHADAVLRFVRTRLRDETEAHDVVHETMLAVWRAAAGFQGRAQVRTWILSLARNKTVDHLRKQGRLELAEPDTTLADDSPNAETVIAASQDARAVRACVEGLSTPQRAAVQLAFFEDRTYAEIAQIEEVPEGTIKTRIYHAKQALMRCLQKFTS